MPTPNGFQPQSASPLAQALAGTAPDQQQANPGTNLFSPEMLMRLLTMIAPPKPAPPQTGLPTVMAVRG